MFMLTAEAASPSNVLRPQAARKIIRKEAKKVMLLMEKRNMLELAKYIHPKFGVRFTYHTTVSRSDIVFSPSQVAHGLKSQRVLTWGKEDGTGKPVRMSFADYLKFVVQPGHFLRARKVSYNKNLHRSNNVENARKFYPNAIMVQYYFPGTKRYSGMDWESLRLFFDKYEGKWYLVGIINDSWSI